MLQRLYGPQSLKHGSLQEKSGNPWFRAAILKLKLHQNLREGWLKYRLQGSTPRSSKLTLSATWEAPSRPRKWSGLGEKRGWREVLLSSRFHLSTRPPSPLPVCPSLGVCSPLVAASLEPTSQCSLENLALHLEVHFKAFSVCISFPLGSSLLGI